MLQTRGMTKKPAEESATAPPPPPAPARPQKKNKKPDAVAKKPRGRPRSVQIVHPGTCECLFCVEVRTKKLQGTEQSIQNVHPETCECLFCADVRAAFQKLASSHPDNASQPTHGARPRYTPEQIEARRARRAERARKWAPALAGAHEPTSPPAVRAPKPAPADEWAGAKVAGAGAAMLLLGIGIARYG